MTKPTHHVAYVRLKSTNGRWLAHRSLRSRLVRDARTRGTTITDVAVEILAKRYGGSYEPTGRTTKPGTSHDILNMRIPMSLWEKVRRAAWNAGRKELDEVRVTLCDHYGLKVSDRPA